VIETQNFHAITVYSDALQNRGLSARGDINGLGLVSQGLIWEWPFIWTDATNPLTTIWTDALEPVTTTWTASNIDPFAGPY
jgi:hypothetical protein